MTATDRESVERQADSLMHGPAPVLRAERREIAAMLLALRERLDVAERDSQRLDWIASHENIDIKSPAWSWEEPNGGRMALGFWAVQGCDANGDWGMLGSSTDDLREAIDAAARPLEERTQHE